MTNGYDAIRSVAAEDVSFSLQTASKGEQKVFVESGGLFILAVILILMWLVFFGSWWTMLGAFVVGMPVYLIWNSVFGGDTPAGTAFFSGSYV